MNFRNLVFKDRGFLYQEEKNSALPFVLLMADGIHMARNSSEQHKIVFQLFIFILF